MEYEGIFNSMDLLLLDRSLDAVAFPQPVGGCG